MKARIALAGAAVALALGSTAAVAAPEVELTILGGQATFNNSSFRAEGSTDEGTQIGEDVADALDLDPEDISADWAPGLRAGIRLGESPVLLTLGARHSDHLDTSYDAGVRLNQMGSNLGLELRAVRFEESDVRDAFGNRDVEGEAAVTYDVANFLRLGAGVTTATLDDQDVNGLLTADIVFKFGGPKDNTPVITIPTVLKPAPKPEPAPVYVPPVEVTGERG